MEIIPLGNRLKLRGYLPEKLGFYEDLTARENLNYIAQLNGLARKQAERKIAEVLANGIDPEGAREILELIFRIGKEQDITLFITTGMVVFIASAPSRGFALRG